MLLKLAFSGKSEEKKQTSFWWYFLLDKRLKDVVHLFFKGHSDNFQYMGTISNTAMMQVGVMSIVALQVWAWDVYVTPEWGVGEATYQLHTSLPQF